jgi:hypothetical protein
VSKYEKHSKKLKDGIPNESNNLQLDTLHAWTTYMKSGSVTKDDHGNVKDFRLKQNQAKELSDKVWDEHAKHFMTKLTGEYKGLNGYEEGMLATFVKGYTGKGKNDWYNDFRDTEVDHDFMVRQTGNMAYRHKQVRENEVLEDVRTGWQEDDKSLKSHLKSAFNKAGIEIDFGKVKSPEEITDHFKQVSEGIGDSEKYMKGFPKHLKKYKPPKKKK